MEVDYNDWILDDIFMGKLWQRHSTQSQAPPSARWQRTHEVTIRKMVSRAVNNGPLEIRPPPIPPLPCSILLLRKDPLKMNNWTISELGPFQGFLRKVRSWKEREIVVLNCVMALRK